MADSVFLTYERTVLDNQTRFESLIQEGQLKPAFIWHFFLLIISPIFALLVPRRNGAQYVRVIVFAVTLSIGTDLLRFRRMLLGANGYLVGLIVIWWLVWSSTLLFFNDAERNFRRVERAVVGSYKSPNGQGDGRKTAPREAETLVWQSYPQTLLHRLGWILGLVLNMRGPEWNWRISCLDPLPPQLDSTPHHTKKRSSCPNANARLRTAFVRFFIAYICIDLLKLLMIRDLYFMGVISAPPPFPLSHLSAIPGLVRTYRLLMSGVGIFLALHLVTALNPICFLGLSLAFPNASQRLFATPLNAPWLYADQFGSLTSILDHGLAGLWGQWWHQIFRFGFTSSAKWVLSLLPTSISSRRSARRTVVTLVSFGISGLMHCGGSYTQLGETQPVSGTFRFFMLQAVGVFVQEVCSCVAVSWLFRHGSAPRWLRRAMNGLFVVGWLLFSGRYIADDFARGGLWLTEPLPVSLLRGLLGQGWICWRSAWFGYYDDGTFWGSGIRML